jgi:arylsulfatase A-like enzyme
VEDIHRLAKQDRPFFLAVGFRKPHLPFNAPARYWRDGQPDTALLPPSWHQPAEGVPSKAFHRSLELRMQYDALPLLGDIDEEGAKQLVRDYHAASRYADAQLGRLITALEDSGVADDTIVVVAGDHGWLLGEQRMWTKHALFETALRTPLIIVDPDRVGGAKVEAVTDLLDLYPTLAQLAGLAVPEGLDGASLSPLLDNPALEQHPEKTVSFSRWLDGESVRDERYRYSAWFDASGQVVAQMLFDLDNDPHELHNVADDADLAPVVARLLGNLRKHRADTPWSAELNSLVERMAFASSSVGPLLMAIMARPGTTLIGVFGFIAVIVAGLLYRRRNRRP